MNKKTYIKNMVRLGEEFERIACSEQYDKDDWQSATDDFVRVNRLWNHSRRRRDWYSIFIIGFLLFCLAWVVWDLFF